MNDYAYVRPTTVNEALALLRDNPEASALAGGQSLLPAMRLGFATPDMLIDLAGITDLSAIEQRGNRLWIGAMASHHDIATSTLLRQQQPGLCALAANIADQQIRHRGTLGGSIANNDPAACYPAGLLALNAIIHTDRRRIQVDDFFVDLFETALADDELVIGVSLETNAGFAYQKFEQPASRFALVGVAVGRHGDQVRVAVTGARSCVFRVRSYEAALERTFDGANLQRIAPPDDCASDIHASAEYRRELIPIICSRVVAALQ